MTRRRPPRADIFENLFVLEAANNHWGNLARGLRIVREHGTVVRYNNVRAAIKFQFRDVDTFIHRDFRGAENLRYIKKTEATRMSMEDFLALVRETINVGCLPMATPFDERSVDLCEQFDLPLIKIASSDINDWPLIERIAATKRPTLISTGGASEKDLDDVVLFFENRGIPLAINHCVSLYPSEDHELELNQIDFLRDRYPGHTIGFSSHEYHDWRSSMLISYAKGARTWERHIDIDADGVQISPYCSVPHQVDEWFKAHHKAREMSGSSSSIRRVVPKQEKEYLDALVRGVYAARDLEPGYVFTKASLGTDFYLAVPLQKGQLSCREVMNGERLVNGIQTHEALSIDHIDGPYSETPILRQLIMDRGL